MLDGTRYCMGVFVAILSASTSTAADSWDVLAEAKEFAATPDRIAADQRPRVVDPMDGQTAEAGAPHAAAVAGQQRAFRVLGHVPDIRAMQWETAIASRDVGDMPYYTIRYKALGQRRDYNPLAVLAVTGLNAKNEIATMPLLDCSEVINDGLWHVVIGRHDQRMTVKAIVVQLSTLDSEATLDVDVCSFHSAIPAFSVGVTHDASKGQADGRFRCLDLSGIFNDEYAMAVERAFNAHGKIVDGATEFAAGHIAVDGVPFTAKVSGKNIVVPPRDLKANAGTVNVLGTELERSNYQRVAREDSITVPADGKASEVCFILVCEMAPSIGRYALPKIPLQLHNFDSLAVETVYTEGEPDWAFPYSVADDGHTLQRMTASYAVPADPKRELQSIVFHNRYDRADFDVAAVTLNTGQATVIPKAVREPEPYRLAQVVRPHGVPPTPTPGNSLESVFTCDGEVVLDRSQGFAIRSLKHGWTPETTIALDPSSGLEVEVEGKLLTGRDFSLLQGCRGNDQPSLEVTSTIPTVPLKFILDVRADPSGQIRFLGTVQNTGDNPVAATIRFPVLKGLALGDLADTWMYFPQCRNVCTNQPGTYLAPNDRPFVTQFFDVFNPKAGIGIAFLTHNLNQDVLDYSVRKDEEGVTAFIQYPADYHVIAPGQTLQLTETRLVFHGGDWHSALAAYQDWLKSWHKPVKANALDWWHRSFDLRAHVTNRSYSWAVPIFDPEKNQYRVDEILQEDLAYLGVKTQVVHLGGWCDYKNMHAGDFNGGDYAVEDYTGGVDVLREAVRKMQTDGVRVSVYTIPDRCAKNSRIGQALGKDIAQINADGQPAQDEKCWYVCIGAKEWSSNYVEGLKRAQKELCLDAIYVDVFGYTRGYACYSQDHGHEVPLNVNKACNELIQSLRHELPEGVAIWSEFLLPDVNSQFTSGNITYYFLTLHEYMVKSYDQPGRAPLFTPLAQSVHRFAFPHVKQFGFPVGFEGGPSSHDLRFLFFNGEGLYDVGWLLYDSRDLARVRNWLAIQTEYADCFASMQPVPLLPTEAGQVYANEFPTEDRTAWTIFNARFATYRGPVLSVEHRDGDTYYDAWNHTQLTPRIVGGQAVISLSLEPQGLGCVVRTGRR